MKQKKINPLGLINISQISIIFSTGMSLPLLSSFQNGTSKANRRPNALRSAGGRWTTRETNEEEEAEGRVAPAPGLAQFST